MRLVIDGEWTVRFDEDGKVMYGSPYDKDNRLVSVGYQVIETGESGYIFYHHKDLGSQAATECFMRHKHLQDLLDKATLVIGHNLKADLSWLYECGFTYNGPLYDTMIFEYTSSKGQKLPVNLAASAERNEVSLKSDILKDYLAKGVNVDEIPMVELEEYGLGDIKSTVELFLKQRARYSAEKDIRTIWPSTKLCNEALEVLIDIERNGICVDAARMNEVETQFRAEQQELLIKLTDMAREVIGDTPVNFASPADMSRLVYSIDVTDKKLWSTTFNIGSEVRGAVRKKKYNKRYSDGDFRKIIRSQCTKIQRTDAMHCVSCDGKGRYFRKKKDGSDFKSDNVCKECNGAKVVYVPNGRVGGFKVRPIDYDYATSNGFSTDKTTITDLIEHGALSDDAQIFLTSLARLNALDTYLTSFIGGIRGSTRTNGICHPNYNQCVTATMRLSSSGPNFQNFPRGNTFPVRSVFISRWASIGGYLMSTDFSALEYRTAVMLANCQPGLQSILDGKDRHELSAAVIYGAIKDEMEKEEWKEIRQKAKASCVPMHSQALTRHGWRQYGDLVVGEDILAYDSECKMNVWTPLLEKVKFENQPVVTISNKHNFSVTCTSDHRWYGTKTNWRGGKTSDIFDAVTLTKNHAITVSAEYGNETGTLLYPGEAEILGLIWTDGSIRVSKLTGRTSQSHGAKRGVNACIIQKKTEGRHFIENVLRWACPDYTVKKHGDNGCVSYHLPADYVRDLYKRAGLDLVSPDKVGFVLRLGAIEVLNFKRACGVAEGTIRQPYGQMRIYQNAGDMKEAIHLASYLSGHEVRVTKTLKENVKGANHDHFTMNLKKPYVTGQRLKVKDAGVEDVWCPRTQYGTWVMRQGEVITITGNTFQPLYSGVGQTEGSKAYAKAFFEEHTGIAAWHKKLLSEAIDNKQVVCPSGMIFAFPEAKRLSADRVVGKTQITNYPVQHFATFAIAWCVFVYLWRSMKERNLKSLLIMQTHDDIVCDVHPDEIDIVLDLTKAAFSRTLTLLKERFNYTTNVPIGFEISKGDNLMNKTTIFVGK